MLSAKTRLLRTLKKEEVDRVPVICPGGMMNMVTRELMELTENYLPSAHKDAKKMSELAYEVYNKGIFENVGVPFCMTVETEMYGAKVDFGSDIFEPHVTEYVMNSVDEIYRLKEANIDEGRSKVVVDAIKMLKEKKLDCPIIGNLTGPISVASSLMEPVVFYKELRKKNEKAHEYMEFITRDLIKFAKAQIEAGADVIAISDPSGTGEILGPKLFKEFCVKYLNMILDAIKEYNVCTIVHICGHMKSVYKEVNEVKSDALSFDAVVPIREAKEALKDRVIMGNVSTYTLEFGEPNKIKLMTKSCINSGSSILAPACGLGMKTPLKNIKAMIDAAKEEL